MKLLRSLAYRLADEDPDFLAHDDARGVRLELEYLKAELQLRRQGVTRTIIVMGSTRAAPRPVLRGGARARPHHRPRRRRGADRPGAGDHGSGEPRRLRGRRALDRAQHRSTAAAAAQPLYHPGALPALPLVLVGEAWWRRAVDFDFLAAEGMIRRRDLRLFRYAETARGVWRLIRRAARRG